jgi:hypothetical protein
MKFFMSIIPMAVAVATTVCAQSPVAYYPLDGNGNDASGNGFNGVVTGTASATDRKGNPNGALLFGDAIDRVNCGNPEAFNFAGPFTISAWVKLNGDRENTYIVAKYDADPFFGGGSPHSYGLGIAGVPYAYSFVGGDAGYSDLVGFATPMNAGLWYAIATVYDGSTLSLYLDGSPVASTFVGLFPPFANSIPLTIGGTSVGQVFGGAIDDVRIYNAGLTADQIAAQYQADLPPVPTAAESLVAYYPLNGNGRDKSGNHIDGSVIGTTRIRDRFGIPNKALAFNGGSDRIVCGNAPQFNFQDAFTISAWVKPNGDKENTYIVAKYDFDFAVGFGSPHSYGLGVAGIPFPYSFVGGDSGYSDLIGWSAPMNAGQWYALATVYDGQNLKLYVDGNLIGQNSVGAFPPFVNSVPLTIGGTSVGQGFSGGIDDVRIYNKGLSVEEIQAQYLEDLTGPGNH